MEIAQDSRRAFVSAGPWPMWAFSLHAAVVMLTRRRPRSEALSRDPSSSSGKHSIHHGLAPSRATPKAALEALVVQLPTNGMDLVGATATSRGMMTILPRRILSPTLDLVHGGRPLRQVPTIAVVGAGVSGNARREVAAAMHSALWQRSVASRLFWRDCQRFCGASKALAWSFFFLG